MIYAYKQFLAGLNILSEDEFKEVLEQFPGIEIDFSTLKLEDYDITQEGLAYYIFENVLSSRWNRVSIEDTYWDNKLVILWDVQSIQDLEEIKATFPMWTIENYDEIIENIKEQEKESKEIQNRLQKDKLLNCLKQLSYEQLEKIIEANDLKK